jgi:serine/threonine protein kinase
LKKILKNINKININEFSKAKNQKNKTKMEDRDDDRLIGRFLFKEYRLKKKLGEGSFGKVYIASNIKTSELYAIKLVSKILFLILTFLKKNRRKKLSKIVF